MKDGCRYGNLTILKEVKNQKTRRFVCRCDCGKYTVKRGDTMRNGSAKSCGCLQIKNSLDAHLKHGFGNHPLYKVWNTIKQRCFSVKRRDFHRYGGRGISICKEWADDFNTFYKWAVYSGYDKGLTIERKDNDGPYSPDNCIWADRTQQANNRRTNRVVFFEGNYLTIAQWSRLFNINQHALRQRIDSGWPIEKALKQPAMIKSYDRF